MPPGSLVSEAGDSLMAFESHCRLAGPGETRKGIRNFTANPKQSVSCPALLGHLAERSFRPAKQLAKPAPNKVVIEVPGGLSQLLGLAEVPPIRLVRAEGLDLFAVGGKPQVGINDGENAFLGHQ